MANCYCLFPTHRSDVTVSQSIYISYLEQRGQSQTVCFCAATACIGQMTARDRDPGQHTWILDSGMPVCWASFSLVAIPGNRFFSKASIRISVWNLEKCVRLLPASLTTEHIGTQQGLQVSFHIQTWKKKSNILNIVLTTFTLGICSTIYYQRTLSLSILSLRWNPRGDRYSITKQQQKQGKGSFSC